MIETARVAVLVLLILCAVLLPASVVARRLREGEFRGGGQ
ncbi:hypothetical protein RKD44_005228 [Streptomyces collinus]